MWQKKRGRPPSPRPGPAAGIFRHLPNGGLMLAQCRRRWTSNKVTLGECLRY